MLRDIYVFGAGGLGREIAATLQLPGFTATYRLRGFVDDGLPAGSLVNGLPVAGNKQWLLKQSGACVVTGIGNPVVRQSLAEEFSKAGLALPVVVHPGARLHQPEYIEVSEGTYLADGVILTTNIRIGKHCMILTAVSLSHDTSIGDCCTLMPGVRISSGAILGNNVVCGTGTLIASFIELPGGSRIAAGTVLLK